MRIILKPLFGIVVTLLLVTGCKSTFPDTGFTVINQGKESKGVVTLREDGLLELDSVDGELVRVTTSPAGDHWDGLAQNGWMFRIYPESGSLSGSITGPGIVGTIYPLRK